MSTKVFKVFFMLNMMCPLLALAQDIKPDSLIRTDAALYRQQPLWIAMMNNPNVNYYEACKAFDLFWENRELPAESEGEAAELFGNEKEADKGVKFKNSETYRYIYSYKQFVNWRKVMENKIDPQTGRLLTEQQQLEIWKEQTKGIDTAIR